MAHRGKYYPVHFRRDFNLNLNSNASGFPMGFRFDGGSLAGAIGVWLNLNRVLVPARFEHTAPRPYWLSEKISGGGRNFYVQIDPDLDGNSGITKLKGEVLDSVAGEVGRFSGVRSSNVSYGVWQGTFDITFVPQPSIFQPVQASTWNTSPMPYSDF